MKQQQNAAFRQYFLKPNGTEEEGHSTIQSADVNSMVTAVAAQMIISFSTDTVVDYEADSAEDEIQAKSESRAVNKILQEENDGEREIYAGIINTALYGNGYYKVWWDDDITKYYVTFDDIEPGDLDVITEKEQGIDRRLVSYDPDKRKARTEVTETK